MKLSFFVEEWGMDGEHYETLDEVLTKEASDE